MFICQPLESGEGYLRVDFSIQCTTADGNTTGVYMLMRIFTIAMIVIHTVGTPARKRPAVMLMGRAP